MRNRRSLWLIGMAAIALLLSIPPLSAAGDSNSYDDHWLAAACTEASTNGRINHQTVVTDFGVAVQHSGRAVGPIVFYCNIDADQYHNWLQFYAEDNSPTASVTVNLYRQDIVSGGAPELLQSVSSTDQPGVQRAEVFIEPPLEFAEIDYMYYLELTINRSTRDTVRLYSVSLRDVL